MQEPDTSAIILSHFKKRHVVFTLVAVEHDAHLKVLPAFVLPPQGPDHNNYLGLGDQVKMDGLEPVCQPSAIFFYTVLPSAERSQMADHACSLDNTPASSSSGKNLLCRSTGSVNRRPKGTKISSSSCQQSSYVSNDSSGSVYDGCSNVDLVQDVPKADKPMKKTAKKKVKKKGKKHKKPLSHSINVTTAYKEGTDLTSAFETSVESINVTAASKEGAGVTSVFETCVDSDSAYGDAHASENATASTVLFQEATMEKADNEDSSNDVLNFSVATTASTSCSDEVDELENPTLPSDFTAKMTHVTRDIRSSAGEEDAAKEHTKQGCNIGDSCSCSFSDEYSAPMFDSFSDGWNSDGSTNENNDVEIQSAIRRKNGVHSSDSGMTCSHSNYGTSLQSVTAGKGCFPCGITFRSKINVISNGKCRRSKAGIDADGKTDRMKCSSGSCSSSDIQSSGKRGGQSRKLTSNSTEMHELSCDIGMHSRAERESNNRVWQKVQKNDMDECVCECTDHLCPEFDALGKTRLEKSPRSACLDEMSTQPETFERLLNAIDSEGSSLKSEDDSSWKTVSGKLKRKPNSRSKQAHNHSSMEGPRTSKPSSGRSTRTNSNWKEASKISSSANYCKSVSNGSRSPCYADRQRVGISPAHRVNFCRSEPLQNSEIHLDEPKLSGDFCAKVYDAHAQIVQHPLSPFSRTSDSLEQTSMLEVDSDSSSDFQKDLHGEHCFSTGNEGKGPVKLKNEVSHAEHCKKDHNFESALQKWIPVERKNAVALETNGFNSIQNSDLGSLVVDICYPKNSKEKSGLNSHSCISLAQSEATCLSPSSAMVDCASPVIEWQADRLTPHMPVLTNEHCSKHVVPNCSSCDKSTYKSISVVETDSHKMQQAVNDAYRLQIESEGVQLATGSPLAEFERVLYSASPVLDQTHTARHCNSCSGNQLIGHSLCRHQIPNISLGSLWQWYEMPGTFGLEVKAEDYHCSKRLSSAPFDFCAYFVPFLSAVQLFGHSRSPTCACHAMPDAQLVRACDADAAPERSSSLDHLPIFSMLLPQPCREENGSISRPMSPLYNSDRSSVQGETCYPSDSSACFCDSDLLFEYFECEQPQQRRPMFEKIKELVRGDSISNCQVFGDSSKLDSMHLHDIHPSSWFSVAWYPIYQIPDGSFRAAFLTYHSLGLFIRRNASLNSLGGGDFIVSPVVGLQSYNAQGECWFQLRNSTAMQTEGNPYFALSEILKERLRTLEQTASVMARASVHKRDQRSVNRHPDYEFFLSRRR